jgi:hypothetical protein
MQLRHGSRSSSLRSSNAPRVASWSAGSSRLRSAPRVGPWPARSARQRSPCSPLRGCLCWIRTSERVGCGSGGGGGEQVGSGWWRGRLGALTSAAPACCSGAASVGSAPPRGWAAGAATVEKESRWGEGGGRDAGEESRGRRGTELGLGFGRLWVGVSGWGGAVGGIRRGGVRKSGEGSCAKRHQHRNQLLCAEILY